MIEERFDLALCLSPVVSQGSLEVHTLVQSLTQLAPVVFFAAPSPALTNDAEDGQWLDPWVTLFATHGYTPSR